MNGEGSSGRLLSVWWGVTCEGEGMEVGLGKGGLGEGSYLLFADEGYR
jgi:hypothetical protein